jgi:curved DNA-binding protein CbpA
MKNYYETLGLQEGASQEEIQNSYERLSKELDPANNDNQDFFKEEFSLLNEAYNALSQSSILKNSDSSGRTIVSETQELSPSKSSGSFTVTISPEKIEELKGKAHENVDKPYKKPSMFKNPFSFEGRIRRMEYGLSFIIFYFSLMFSSALAARTPLFFFILCVPLYWFLWAQGAKRCHDRNHSGWYQIIPFYVFWLIFADGYIGSNEYGSNPKGIDKIN